MSDDILDSSLLYFVRYESIIQVDAHINYLSTYLNYSDDILFHMICNQLDTAKMLVHHLKDKSSLQYYTDYLVHDIAWIRLFMIFNLRLHHSMLFTACRLGDGDLVKELITQHNMDFRMYNYYSLIILSMYGRLNILRHIIEHYMSVNEVESLIRDKYIYILDYASRYGHLDIVKYLLDIGFDRSDNVHASFSSACIRGHLHIVKHMHDRLENVLSSDQCKYALRWTYFNHHLDIVKYLLVNNVDHNELLSEAILNNDNKMIEYINKLNAVC